MLVISVAPEIFLDLILKSFRKEFPGIVIDLLISNNQIYRLTNLNLFDNVVSVEEISPSIVRSKMVNRNEFKYDITLLITEQSSIGFDDPIVFQVARRMGRKVILVDYNMKFYNRFFSHWISPLRKRARNWIFYKQEPLLLIKDFLYLFKNGILVLLFKKRIETPGMEKARKMRDRTLKAQKDAIRKNLSI